MPKLKYAGVAGCIILAFRFVALGLIASSIGIRNTPDDYNWHLSAVLGISALAQFANLYVTKKRRNKEQYRST